MGTDKETAPSTPLVAIAGAPYCPDAIEIEMAKLTMAPSGPRRAAALIALRALSNPEWRRAFEAKGAKHDEPKSAPSFFKGAPDSGLGSAEMAAWATAKAAKLKSVKPTQSKTLARFKDFDAAFKRTGFVLVALLTAVFFVVAWQDRANPIILGASVIFAVIAKASWSKLSVRVAAPSALLAATSLLINVPLGVLAAAGGSALLFFAHKLQSDALKEEEAILNFKEVSNFTLPNEEDLYPWRQESPATRFGSSLVDARSAAALLRLTADRYQINLKDVSSTDLVAAVVAADAWMLCYGATKLTQAASFGPDAVLTLGAVLARVAGEGEEPSKLEGEAFLGISEVEGFGGSVADWKGWIERLTSSPEEVKEVWLRVATDLSAGAPDSVTSKAARTIASLML